MTSAKIFLYFKIRIRNPIKGAASIEAKTNTTNSLGIPAENTFLTLDHKLIKHYPVLPETSYESVNKKNYPVI